MRFTRNDLPKGSNSLRSFLLTHNLKIADRNENGYLVAVYRTSSAINKLKAHIEKNRTESRMRMHIPMWEMNLKILEDLNND